MYADDINLFHSYDSVTVIQRPQKKKKRRKLASKYYYLVHHLHTLYKR